MMHPLYNRDPGDECDFDDDPPIDDEPPYGSFPEERGGPMDLIGAPYDQARRELDHRFGR